jgi:glutamate formiminotransferase
VDVIESVPNISEGRRLDVVQRIAAAAGSVPGTRVLDVHSDPDHNRSVITMAGPAPAVAESAVRLAAAAVGAIDMRVHDGVHPRIGAVDVLPFVPLKSTTMDRCIAVAHEVGGRLAAELGIPIYFYGEAALLPERRLLVNIRRGEYELLREVVATNPASAPDRGPAVLGPAGATAVGARKALIAFNIHLRTRDLRIAQAIARRVRASSGGLPGVQALGLPLPHAGLVQVSMNLTDLDMTPLHVAVAAVHAAARRYGVEIGDSELVGLLPAAAALEAAAVALGLPDLQSRQIIELATHGSSERVEQTDSPEDPLSLH